MSSHLSQQNSATRSEERRALVLLGITAVLVSILGAMYAAILTRTGKLEDFYFNFPPYLKVPHLTTYLIPVFETLVLFWIGYAFFTFWYFCEDWLPGRKGTAFRNISHQISILFLGFYVIYIIWLIPVAYLALVWIPGDWKSLYFDIAFALLVVLEERLYELATGRRGLLQETTKKSLHLFFKVGNELVGAITEGFETIWTKLKTTRPTRFLLGALRIFVLFLKGWGVYIAQGIILLMGLIGAGYIEGIPIDSTRAYVVDAGIGGFFVSALILRRRRPSSRMTLEYARRAYRLPAWTLTVAAAVIARPVLAVIQYLGTLNGFYQNLALAIGILAFLALLGTLVSFADSFKKQEDEMVKEFEAKNPKVQATQP